MEYPKLTSAEYVRGFTLRLAFADGIKAEIDFQNELSGGVFEDLKDPAYFRSFTLHSQFGSIEWANGADFAPEFLYDLAKSSAQRSAGPDSRVHSRKSA